MRLYAALFLVLSTCEFAFGQSIQKNPVKEEGPAKSFPVDTMPFLWKHYQEAATYFASHPETLQQPTLRKTTAWSVGNTHTWWVSNLASDTYYQTASTCKAVGKHCYIFVEDSIWNVRVTQGAVDSIMNDFDNKTPADPTKGIFQMDSSAFGAPPDVDGDPKIVILICNIQDGFTGTGGYVEGFFDPVQETSGSHSNHTEIYYLDANPTDLSKASGIQSAMSTAAHEFQHMINYNYHKTSPSPTFINESCSKLAEVYCGYPVTGADLYVNETNHYLFDWRRDDNTLVLNDYSRAQRFSLYMWDRYGIGLFKYIVQSQEVSETAILNDAYLKFGLSISFDHLFPNWLIANELNDTTVDRLYGYAYPGLPVSKGKTFYNPNTSSTDTVQHIGAEYLIFKNGSDLKITFTNTGGNTNLAIKAIEMGPGSKKVVDVPFGSQFAEPDYGTTYESIAFVVYNQDPNYSAAYSYQATGVVPASITELKWDTTEPAGYFPWSENDTVCVTFDAFSQGILDSVRVALRSAGSISGGVYQYTGVERPTPLGQLLAPITASISTTSPTPYPVPYENWTTIDLTSQNIHTDQPFAVAFVVGSDPKAPGVMITNYPGQDYYHSYTYINSTDVPPNPAGWYYFTSSDSTVAIYLIRAYVGVMDGVKQVVELAPRQFNLSQNYPNPFNPTTNISYRISDVGFVSLKVYDVLGRLVKTLVDKVEMPGDHEVQLDASGLPSGVYFYRLQAGNYSQSRKLLLVK